MNETLRLFPPEIKVERRATRDYEFKELGLKVHKGTKVYVPIYAIHRDPEYWPDPDKFDPSRFLPENKGNIVPYSFLAFVAGPRMCAGQLFAMLEVKTTLAALLLRYDILPCPERMQEPLDFSPTTLIPRAGDLWFSFSLRPDAQQFARALTA